MIQVGDVLSGRTLNFSFPNGMTFAESGTVFSSDNYSVEMVYDETTDGNDVTTITMTVVLNDSDSTLIETFYSANTVSGTTTTTVNLTTYTLPTSFGVCSSIDDTVVAYQYITAVMGTPLCSDTLNMASYQTTHDEAAKTATNYLHYDTTNGLVISEDAATDPTLLSGGNVRITSDGMKLYKGQTQVANFGTTVELGQETGAKMYIDSDTISAVNTVGFKFFSVDMDGDSASTYYRVTKDEDVSAYQGQTYSLLINMDFSPFIQPVGESIHFDLTVYDSNDTITESYYMGTVVNGTPSTGTVYNAEQTKTFTFSYDGDMGLTISCYVETGDARWHIPLLADYSGKTPSYTLGTRSDDAKGSYSITLGEMLEAGTDNQTVIGKYNLSTDDSQAAFVLGSGNQYFRYNGFALDWRGNIHSRALDRGLLTGTSVDYNTYEDYEVEFNHTFAREPIVVATFVSTSTAPAFGRCNLSVHSITRTGFTVRIFNGESSGSRSPNVNWIAMLTETLEGILD